MPPTDGTMDENVGKVIRSNRTWLMGSVYQYVAECDNMVIASPIWLSSLSGPLLSI